MRSVLTKMCLSDNEGRAHLGVSLSDNEERAHLDVSLSDNEGRAHLGVSLSDNEERAHLDVSLSDNEGRAHLGVSLVVQMVVGAAHNEFLHAVSGLGVLVFLQIEVAQLRPRLVVAHVAENGHLCVT